MNQSGIEGANNGNINIQDSAMNEENLKPPITDDRAVSISVTDVDVKPKDSDGYPNLDDVNLMKRTTIGEVNVLDDNLDSRNGVKRNKPVTYAAKKTVAQGMMDLALLTSNANQLRNLVTYQSTTATYYFVMILIILSLTLQISVGVSLIFKGRFDTKGKDKAAAARVNKQIMAAVFLITIINIFIAVFSMPGNPPSPTTQNADRTSSTASS